MKGFTKDGKFRPINTSKGTRKKKEPFEVKKTEGVPMNKLVQMQRADVGRRKRTEQTLKPITKDSKVNGKMIFFEKAEIESVNYKFMWNGDIFYPKGIEKEILLDSNAKKLSDAEVSIIKRRAKFDGTNDEFLDSLQSGSTYGDSWLYDNVVFGELIDEKETVTPQGIDDDTKTYFMLDDQGFKGSGKHLYDVTELRGESVSSSGDPLDQIYEFLFPQVDFAFKVEGREFAVDYTGAHDFEIGTGFGDPSDKDLKKVRELLEEKIFEEREAFTRKHGVQRR